ncbi:hypothetical protein HHI36_009142 [Cryptolaemus montrouzieri]|uniref:ENTH domain-containing protein n=1 Tax=Cryptolaemus montrouzieri TaxID=559131 RepID=A0ABD2MUK5_9CUCU
MENFFSMWKVREIADKVTNVVMNYTEIEAKVREATNDEAWGPTGQIMQELAHSTFTYEHFPEVMSMLWKRMLQDNKQNWRRTYKSLLLLNYLIKNGSERVVTSAREHIYDLRSLENYTFMDDNGKDQGVNIRHKVKELIEFVQDDDRLREERKKAKKNKDKYTGISSDTFGMRFGSQETWDERPSYNHSREEYPAEREWDDTSGYPNSYRDHTYDEVLEGKADSDTESTKNQRQSPTKKYSDNENNSNHTQTENRVNLSLNASLVNSPKKINKPIKKVDLGAAANFGRESVQSPVPIKSSTTEDLLNDDFDPRADEIIPSSKSASDFAGLESAFGENTTQSSNEEFADFTSAFSSPTTPAQGGDFAQFPPVNNFAAFSAVSSPTGQPLVIPTAQSLVSPTAQPMMPPMVQAGSQPLVSSFVQPNMFQSTAVDGTPLMGSSFPQNNFIGNLGPTAMMPQAATPVNQGNNVNDLLGDFGGLSLQTPMGGQNNNSFNSDKGVGLSKRRQSKMNREIKEEFSRTLSGLQAIEKITKESDIDNILNILDNLLSVFPGPLTVQKLLKIDDESIEYPMDLYGMILEDLIGKFDENFPVKNGEIHSTVVNVFVVDNSEFFSVSLKKLLEDMNVIDNKGKKNLPLLLETLLQNEGLFALMMDYVVNINSLDAKNIAYKEIEWSSIVQSIISIPNKLANRFEGHLEDFFLPQNFIGFLYFNIVKVIEFLSDMKDFNELIVSYKLLGVL